MPLALTLALAIVTAAPPLAGAQEKMIWVFDDFEDGDRVAAGGEPLGEMADQHLGPARGGKGAGDDERDAHQRPSSR